MATLLKLSAADKKHFIALAKTKPLGKGGRVFVGDRKFRGKMLCRYFGGAIHGDEDDQDTSFTGAGGCDYYIPRNTWIGLFGATNYPKAAAKKVVKKKVAAKKVVDVRVPVTRKLAQAHAAAKAAAGERIILSDGKVAELNDDVYISFSWREVQEILGFDASKYLPTDIEIAKKIFAAELPVIWGYTDNSAGYRFVGFNGEFGEFKLAPKSVVVNGETGEDKGGYWKFGCANISTDELRHARNFLQVSKRIIDKHKSVNRNVEGVMIGKGLFTLEILERMSLA